MAILSFRLPTLACILLVMAAHGQADMTPAQYWKTVLPNTPIPTIISWALNNQNNALRASTIVAKPDGTGKWGGPGGVDGAARTVLPAATIVAKPDGTGSWGGPGGVDGAATTVLPAATIVAKPDGTGSWGAPAGAAPAALLPAATIVAKPDGTGKWNEPGGTGVDADEKQATINTTFYFFEKDLLPGTKMEPTFIKPVAGVSFLPRRAADAMPFSTAKLPEILKRFDVQPGTFPAKAMAITLQYCEAQPVRGERRRCATSLESMVDYAVATLGTKQLQAVSTVSTSDDIPKSQFTVQSTRKIEPAGGNGGVLACHFEPYPYAVFLCHTLPKTTAYVVTLAGDDGAKKLEAVAVCHADTGTWNPNHVAFKVTHVKPGTVPICHFSKHGVVWTVLS